MYCLVGIFIVSVECFNDVSFNFICLNNLGNRSSRFNLM